MSRPLVNPRMLEHLEPSFYRGGCTIQENIPSRNAYGEDVAAWSDLAGHVAIPCHLAPDTGRETRGAELTISETTHVALLSGRYDRIDNTHRAVIDDVVYDIVGVDHDAQDSMTRLRLRIVQA